MMKGVQEVVQSIALSFSSST